ncbi:2-succinyl-6-hydroxy-2,4-cyclohexadiene-1-carboxylate synthase [Rivularia sp. UHCC 0363]|uniref:2-succinyl-6-hydroxy-2, 4-cyclohexadiene-1-carboxylate synthase n=1 Tax=Rivularia sp. UHCC 0363 TaxID=3110244 RepID=UPI002B1FE9C3|nr:2-succinyl-6-hydroxy-2,4-cyclohexadiene-1-carboxylate synthase [Rivularia sp. UHCC 0363]MEA5593096.1 2-succinyl-6-hydroxy-2,4-cyclohexadiene-1-carboxylate synthase [Rivularia sp. UHCC 0363]
MSLNHIFHYFSGNSNKPLIIFLHGFMGNTNEFDEVISLLKNDFYFLNIDLPGHGKTQMLGNDNCYTMAHTADILIKLLDQLKVDRCFLLGYSMGGRLALYLTLHFPQRFYKVILESASPGLLTEKERLERIKRDEQIARKLARSIGSDFNKFLENWYNQLIFGNIKKHLQFEQMIANRLQNNPLELAKSLRLMGTGVQPALWEKLRENQVPLLLLVGENDQKFIEINRRMTQINNLCELRIIENAAHNIHLENTLKFVQNIRDFFNLS